MNELLKFLTNGVFVSVEPFLKSQDAKQKFKYLLPYTILTIIVIGQLLSMLFQTNTGWPFSHLPMYANLNHQKKLTRIAFIGNHREQTIDLLKHKYLSYSQYRILNFQINQKKKDPNRKKYYQEILNFIGKQYTPHLLPMKIQIWEYRWQVKFPADNRDSPDTKILIFSGTVQ